MERHSHEGAHPDDQDVLEAVAYLLQEAFENHPTPGNAYLDDDTAFLPSLGRLSSEQASRPQVPGGTTIAGHVEHTRYYLEVVQEFWSGRTEKVDWRESWLVSVVTAEQWDELRRRLEHEYRRLLERVHENDLWDGNRITGAFGVVAHCAYHLGAVRQMMKVVAG